MFQKLHFFWCQHERWEEPRWPPLVRRPGVPRRTMNMIADPSPFSPYSLLVRAGLRNSAEFQKLDKHIEKERKKRQRMMDPDAPRPFWQVAPFLCIPVLAAFMVHWVIHHIEDYIPE